MKSTWTEAQVWARLVADLWERTGRNPTDREAREMLTAARLIATHAGQQ
jgi:hypothetical protein